MEELKKKMKKLNAQIVNKGWECLNVHKIIHKKRKYVVFLHFLSLIKQEVLHKSKGILI